MKKSLQRKTQRGIIDLLKKLPRNYNLTGRGHDERISIHQGKSLHGIIEWLEEKGLYHLYDTAKRRYRSQGCFYYIPTEVFEVIKSNEWFFKPIDLSIKRNQMIPRPPLRKK